MKSLILNKIKEHKELSIFILILGVFILFSKLTGQESPSPKTVPSSAESTTTDVSTFIPNGHLLVPLEIANYEILDSIFGAFGVVDLYEQNPINKTFSRFVAKHVKLIRAPKNPNYFAALVSEADASKLAQFKQPFLAMVHNPKTTGTQFEKEKKSLPSRIRYNIGD